MVKAYLDGISSLTAAFAGSYAIFDMINFWELFDQLGRNGAAELETTQALCLINVARCFSAELWGRVCSTFESKAKVKQYIESEPLLLVKTTFVWCGYYASNIEFQMLKPIYVPTADKYIHVRSGADLVYLLGDTHANFGLFVEAILAQADKARDGRVVYAYLEKMTPGDLLQGGEFAMMTEFWDWARDKNWAGVVLTAQDLGIDMDAFVIVERASSSMKF
ncbi:NmrA-like family protein-like protein [Biscogniauxia marginata]|nr:NmrA-like family protein-like protein [Biscogniauxia marginata]